jgi:hypothetical protein
MFIDTVLTSHRKWKCTSHRRFTHTSSRCPFHFGDNHYRKRTHGDVLNRQESTFWISNCLQHFRIGLFTSTIVYRKAIAFQMGVHHHGVQAGASNHVSKHCIKVSRPHFFSKVATVGIQIFRYCLDRRITSYVLGVETWLIWAGKGLDNIPFSTSFIVAWIFLVRIGVLFSKQTSRQITIMRITACLRMIPWLERSY